MVATRLIFVSGKGGTGKSAVAAGLAITRARGGESVLALDMAVSPGLATHLGSKRLGYKPIEVRDGLFAMSVNRAAALDEYLKLQLRVPQGAPTKQIAGVLNLLADTAPGVREIISVGKPVHETWKGTWDTVVVDAPSLGQFRSYLRAPKTIAELVSTGNVRRQARALEETLHDSAVTSIVFVTNPAELPINETVESIDIMRTESLGPRPTIVMNRLLPAGLIDPDQLDALPPGPVRDAAELQTRLEAEQAMWVEAIDAAWSLPYLRGILTPHEISLQLSDAMGPVE
ncbi:MAG: hypothetical protein BMS9Abin12_0971 [Acidimicrobiia bacterium]|nr:MAG: hypothetical protein BMS9Abin12_0971 [Acidimicrobiia bacterium]